MKETYILEGNISVKAAILAKHRTIYTIFVDKMKKDKDTSFILKQARDRNIQIVLCDRKEIDDRAQGKTHGGLIAEAGERDYQTLDACIQEQNVFLCLLEGIEDPYNFGQILRCLYAAGCHGVIIPPRNWITAASVVTKASAGASEYLSLIIADNMTSLLDEMKRKEIVLVCAKRKDAISLYTYTFPKRICIAIGGEMRGLSKTVEQASDQNIYIPYRQDFKNAMSASSSAAVMAFEYVRQTTKE